MPRPAKGARLWLRPERLDDQGRVRERSTWIIRDGSKTVSTGCAPEARADAEKCLSAYIEQKYRPARRRREIEEIGIADVLAIYLEDTRESQANKRAFDGRIERLAEWWGEKTLSEVTGETCRAYVEHRASAERQAVSGKRGAVGRKGTSGGARRDLEDLRAAINHHHGQGLHREAIRVILPEKGAARDRWLTRSEAARLVWFCWRYRDTQTWNKGTRAGKSVVTNKRSLRHIARFILIGLYTGTRAGAIASASPYKSAGHSWVDLESGRFYRLAEGKKATNKRQPTARIPSRLLAHLRRWSRATQGKDGPPVMRTHFVEWRGKPVGSVKVAFGRAVRAVGLGDDVSPHTLRHTAATWLMQRGVDKYEAAGFLGMSLKMIDEVYGHHHPDFQDSIDAAFATRKPANQGPHRFAGRHVSVGITVGVEGDAAKDMV
jgi:integrase